MFSKAITEPLQKTFPYKGCKIYLGKKISFFFCEICFSSRIFGISATIRIGRDVLCLPYGGLCYTLPSKWVSFVSCMVAQLCAQFCSSSYSYNLFDYYLKPRNYWFIVILKGTKKYLIEIMARRRGCTESKHLIQGLFQIPRCHHKSIILRKTKNRILWPLSIITTFWTDRHT